jgi:hypothetical protein
MSASDNEFAPEELQFPAHINPDDFLSPGFFLQTLREPGVVAIGPEFDEENTREKAAEEAKSLGYNLWTIATYKHDGTLARFPVYGVHKDSTVFSAGGERVVFNVPYPYTVTQEHFSAAENLVASDPKLQALSEGEKKREIMRAALALAVSGPSGISEMILSQSPEDEEELGDED